MNNNDKVKDIWGELSHKLFNHIKSKVKNTVDAEDILQEVFIKVYKNIDTLNEQSKLQSWVYKITNNTIIDYYRKSKELSINVDELEKELKESEIENMNSEISQCLEKMVDELPNNYREVIKLHNLKGMKHKEISSKLGISVSCSKMRAQRGKAKLKEILLDCCDFELDSFGNIIDYKQKKTHCNRCHDFKTS